MKKSILIISILALAACTVEEQTGFTPKDEKPVEIASAEVPGVATVQFDDNLVALIESGAGEDGMLTKSAGLNAVFSDLGIVSLERVFPDAGEFEERSRREGLHKFYTVTFSEETPVTKAVTDLSSVPGIESVEPVRKIKRRGFNDPRFSSQWHYVNTAKEGADINVQKVWDNYTVGSPNVIVCVVDEAIDVSHEDLKANLWDDGSGHHGYNFVKSSYNLTISNQDIGHGTHVAGTVSAVSNNSKGVAGIAGGDYAAGKQGVLLMSCQIFAGNDGASDSATANAIKWGADNGALISQNSWGYYADFDEDGYVSSSELAEFKQYKIDSATKKAIDYFIKYAGCDAQGNQKPDSPMKGGLVIFAAGNENIDYDPICAYEPVIAVGAFGRTGNKSSFSNWGDWVDLGAPGGDGSHGIWSTLPTKLTSSGYGGADWQGTSMACPHASGVAALIISYFGKQGFTSEMCREYLLEGAIDGYFSGSRAIGRKLDAYNSFQYGLTHGGEISEDPVAPEISLQYESVTVKAHETAVVAVVVTDGNGDKVTLSCDTGSDAATLEADGIAYKLTIVGRNAPAGNYTATFAATDATGLTTEKTFSYTILENHAPVANRSLDNIVMTTLGATIPVDIAGIFTDPDGETLTYSFTLSEYNNVNTMVSGSSLNITPLRYSVTDVTMTAADSFGLTASVQFSVLARNPEDPRISSYPNPATDVLNVRIDSPEAETDIKLVSASGAIVYHEVVSKASAFNIMPLDITKIAPGVYTLLVSYEGHTVSKKIVKV